jgi:Holliday junction resolvasome RuvABC endonuclease subunit
MKVKQDILDQVPETSMGDSYRLFLDLSSTCSGYSVAKMEGRKCTIVRAGAMWFPSDCANGQKYYQMQQAVSEFYTVNAVTDIIYESYHVNPNQVGNSLVVPEMIGAMKAACYDVFGMPIGCEELGPTSWRGILGIQAIKTPKLDKQGKPTFKKSRSGRMMEAVERDYKTPTINYVDKILDNQIPKMLKSNITGKERATPNDLYDSLAICIAWHKKFGCTEFILQPGSIDGSV